MRNEYQRAWKQAYARWRLELTAKGSNALNRSKLKAIRGLTLTLTLTLTSTLTPEFKASRDAQLASATRVWESAKAKSPLIRTRTRIRKRICIVYGSVSDWLLFWRRSMVNSNETSETRGSGCNGSRGELYTEPYIRIRIYGPYLSGFLSCRIMKFAKPSISAILATLEYDFTDAASKAAAAVDLVPDKSVFKTVSAVEAAIRIRIRIRI